MSKLRCVQISFKGGGKKYIVATTDILALEDEIACAELGDKWELEIIEMEENEYANLPEFEGLG